MGGGITGSSTDMRSGVHNSAKRLCTAARCLALPASLQQAPRSLSRAARGSMVPPQAVLAAPAAPQQQLFKQPSMSRSKAAELPSPPLAYEVIQGALVRWSEIQPGKAPPTAVLVHGVLGSRKNMQSFARQVVEAFPSWQVLLVDLRCHGESAPISLGKAPHTIKSAAEDIMALMSRLRLFPQALIGHSLGGKIVMRVAEQFSEHATSLPRPVQVWVLDALPGDVRAGGAARQDHPADLISSLQSVSLPLPNRTTLQALLAQEGFSPPIAKWASTNLRAINGDHRKLTWGFDLPGIHDLYQSYEACDMWQFLSTPAQGITVNFVRAERSVFKWVQPVVDRIVSLGHQVHVLPGSGHWVHTDNPDGLLQILAPSLGSSRH